MNELNTALANGNWDEAWEIFRLFYPVDVLSLPAVYVPIAALLIFFITKQMRRATTALISVLVYYYAWGTYWVSGAVAQPDLVNFGIFAGIIAALALVNLWVFWIKPH